MKNVKQPIKLRKRSRVISKNSLVSHVDIIQAAALLSFISMVYMIYAAISSDSFPRAKQLSPIVAFEHCGDDESRVNQVEFDVQDCHFWMMNRVQNCYA